MSDFPATPPLPDDLRSLLYFGGTFDPPHRAHVTLLKKATRRLQCDHTLLIPACRSPHKGEEDDAADGQHRFNMLQLLFADESSVSISSFEIERPPPSFAVQTLEALRDSLDKSVTIRLLIGSDQAIVFHDWHRWERILELATPAVLLRPPHESGWDALVEDGMDPSIFRPEWILTDLPIDDVSATEIRDRLRRGRDVSNLVPNEVLQYIRAHDLYGS